MAIGRPDVRRLLLWAEKQTPAIDEGAQKEAAHEVGLEGDDGVKSVSYDLFEAVKSIIDDSLLSRARACGDN